MNPWTPKMWFDMLRKIGSEVGGDADTARMARYAMHLAEVAGGAGDRPRTMTMAVMVGFCARWCRSGFPAIEMSDTLFASLMCTKMPPELMPDIRLPWETFIVRIPPRFQVHNDFGWGPGKQALAYMAYEHVPSEGGGNLNICPLGCPGTSISVGFKSLAELATERPGARAGADIAPWMDECPDDVAVDEHDATLMYRRVFIGAMIEMMSPSMASAVARAKALGVREKRGMPRGWTYRLTRNVRLDCRDRAEAALRGTGKRAAATPSVQVLVRGHWKRQPCGAQGTERRFIHVEPYWRGPEDAPIAVRSHVLVNAGAQ